MIDLSGQTFGQYQLIERIGNGGMATVYAANQMSMGRKVAVKILHQSLIEQDPSFLARFCNEAQIVARLQHPHIVPVYDYGEFDSQPYLVMAYLTGGTLEDYINQRGHLPLSESLRLMRQITDALAHAHQLGIIHRDFKPSNVLLDEPGNAYLADFGLSHILQQSPRITGPGIVGTPVYLAPDWTTSNEISTSIDTYALGITLFEMLTGHTPYNATSHMGIILAHLNEPIPDIRADRPDLPPAIQNVIEAALAKNKSDRFSSVTDLMLVLEAAAERERPPQMLSQSGLHNPVFPAAWALDNLMGASEVLGMESYNAVLIEAGLEHLIDNFPPANEHVAFPVTDLGKFWQTLYQMYGIRGLHALGRRAGQQIQSNDNDSILRQAAAVILRTPGLANSKIRWGLEFLARVFNAKSSQDISLTETPDYFIWQVQGCPTCWGWHADEPVCHNWIGYLQGEIAWAFAKHVRIIETECRAMGADACVFRIYKQPDN